MLGWHISVYRQNPPSKEPALWEFAVGGKIAVWSTGLDGMDWLKDLEKNGDGVDLGGDGYPYKFTIPAKALTSYLDLLRPDSPLWKRGLADDVFIRRHEGVVNIESLNDCDPDDWLMIRVCDLS